MNGDAYEGALLSVQIPAVSARCSHASRNDYRGPTYKYGYTPALVDMEQLLRNADETLFCKALKDVHCLHHLLSELKIPHIQLRPANHNYHLPMCKYKLYKRSSIVRSLFNINFNYQ